MGRTPEQVRDGSSMSDLSVAVEVVATELFYIARPELRGGPIDLVAKRNWMWSKRQDAEQVVAALAAEGWSVVRTEDQE